MAYLYLKHLQIKVEYNQQLRFASLAVYNPCLISIHNN